MTSSFKNTSEERIQDMNDAAKIDFDPSLFGDKKNTTRNEINEQLSINLKPKPRRWAYIVAIFVVGIVFIAFTVRDAYKVTTKANHLIDPFSIKSVALLKETMIQETAMENQGIANTPSVSPAMQVYSSPDRWCNGDEIMCTTTTTTKPTETLQKLIAAIPHDKTKQYKIRLSVTPVQEVGIEIENIEKNEKMIKD